MERFQKWGKDKIQNKIFWNFNTSIKMDTKSHSGIFLA